MSQKKFFEKLAASSPVVPPFMLDLSLWFAWHSKQGTLPSSWSKLSQLEIAKELGSSGWLPVAPWSSAYEGVDVRVEQSEHEKTVHYDLGHKKLTASWTLGPDGDWWQMDHLIKSEQDFEPALELAESLVYALDETKWVDPDTLGENTVVAIELPRRPFSDLLHDFLGWGEGLLMLRDHEDKVDSLISILDKKLQQLVKDLSEMPGAALLSPDNLDGQYISPDMFARYLSPSYSKSSQSIHASEKSLVVHVGGPMSRLLGPLADCGVDVVEGVSGPPQSDVPLEEARQYAGPELTLWGGVPQDWLLETTTTEDFEANLSKAVDLVIEDGNAILGVADRVPVLAEVDRLARFHSIVKSRL